MVCLQLGIVATKELNQKRLAKELSFGFTDSTYIPNIPRAIVRRCTGSTNSSPPQRLFDSSESHRHREVMPHTLYIESPSPHGHVHELALIP